MLESTPRFARLLQPSTRLDSHHRVFSALLIAAAVSLALWNNTACALHLTFTWIAFAGVLLLLAWGVIIAGDPARVRASAKLQDPGRTVIFVIVLASSVGSLTAAAAVLGEARGLQGASFTWHALVAVVAVTLSWLLVHSVFALHYAHIFYGTGDTHGATHGGLVFPGGRQPDFLDFAYFSFVIGMTSQVSDVQVASRRLRRLTLAHGVISFAFNTIILALTINMVAALVLG